MTWQPAAILYPDAEFVGTSLLRGLLAAQGETDVDVVRDIPDPRPTRCVQLVRDGGLSANLRDQARLRANVWDENAEAAIDLTRLVAALVPLMAGQSGVLRTQLLSGPYEIPDAGAARQYLLFQIDLRGEAL